MGSPVGELRRYCKDYGGPFEGRSLAGTHYSLSASTIFAQLRLSAKWWAKPQPKQWANLSEHVAKTIGNPPWGSPKRDSHLGMHALFPAEMVSKT